MSAFPPGPILGQTFYRTDLMLECQWDGERWITVRSWTTTSSARRSMSDRLRAFLAGLKRKQGWSR